MALPTLQQYNNQKVEGVDFAYQTPLISQEQYNQLDRLVGAAAFDDDIQHRLVRLRDETLREAYHLSAITWGYLKSIEADTLEEFCSQVLKLQDTMLSH